MTNMSRNRPSKARFLISSRFSSSVYRPAMILACWVYLSPVVNDVGFGSKVGARATRHRTPIRFPSARGIRHQSPDRSLPRNCRPTKSRDFLFGFFFVAGFRGARLESFHVQDRDRICHLLSVSLYQTFPPMAATKKDIYLVIGGSGFLGRHIVTQLRERGDEVSVFDIVQRYHDTPFFSGDITQKDQVADAIRIVRPIFLFPPYVFFSSSIFPFSSYVERNDVHNPHRRPASGQRQRSFTS
jgi:hypothetical protein